MRPHLPLLIIAATGLAACSSSDARERVDAGPSSTQRYDLAGFTEVELEASDDVTVRVGPAFSVEATGPVKKLERLDIRVSGDRLVVGRKRDSNWSFRWKSDSEPVRIAVTMPALKAAVLAGSGDLTVAGATGASLTMALRGSGNLRADAVRADRLDAELAGSGNLVLAGGAKNASLNLAGSGNIDARSLSSEGIKAVIAGSGNIDARGTGRAELSVIGSGNITVEGTKDCSISRVGSGDARCRG